jgi:hypothetical protein
MPFQRVTAVAAAASMHDDRRAAIKVKRSLPIFDEALE